MTPVSLKVSCSTLKVIGVVTEVVIVSVDTIVLVSPSDLYNLNVIVWEDATDKEPVTCPTKTLLFIAPGTVNALKLAVGKTSSLSESS